METLHGVLMPRKDLAPAQLKSLYEWLGTWIESEEQRGIGILWDGHAVADLAAGEMPRPLAILESQRPFKAGDDDELEYQSPEPGALKEQVEKLGEAASLRILRFSATAIDGGDIPGGADAFYVRIKDGCGSLLSAVVKM